MTVDAPAPALEDPRLDAARPWERALLWAGAPLCLAGLLATGIAGQWRGGRFAELLVLALAGLLGAVLLQRLLRWRLASGLACAWLVALAVFAGPLPLLAVAAFGLAALAVGGVAGSSAPAALRMACGFALCAGALAWLLPLPVHYRATYLAACAALVAWRWRALRDAGRGALVAWREAVDAAPRPAAFALVVLGLASTGCWLPTMQADDVVYHLRLPWQLAQSHHYPLDPALHIWALAPWAGDVLHAVPQVLAGAEARGPLNLLWIALTAAGVWRIVSALQGGARAAWLAIALYASLPLTAALAGGMQTETPTTALLAWLAWVVLDDRLAPHARLVAIALLAGGLWALKLAAGLLALPLLAWALLRHRHLRSPASLALAPGIVAIVAGSSYVFAGVVARNPFLPLFNAWFRSPYFDPVNFDDTRWHAGFGPALPWNLTFHTERYLEAFAGGGGFVLVALAGAWLLALLHRPTRPFAAMGTLLVILPLLPIQYLRYAFPATVLMLPVLAIASLRADARRGAWLVAGVCMLNLAFQANGFWLLRVGAVKAAVLAGGRDAPLLREHVPERNLAMALRGSARGQVLALDASRPYVAELGVRGRSVSYYDRPMQRAATHADAVPDGSGWAALFEREGISDVLVRPSALTPAQRAGLARAGATRAMAEGDVEWWRIPAGAPR